MFNNMTVRTKLTLAFGGLAMMVLLISGLAIKTLSNANDRFHDFVKGANARADVAHRVREAVDLRAIAARNLILVTKPEDTALEKQIVSQAHADVTANMAKLVKMAQTEGVSEEERSMITKIGKIEKAYAPVALSIVDAALTNHKEAAITQIDNDCRPLLAALIKATTDYANFAVNQSGLMAKEAAEKYATQRDILISGCLLVLLGAIAAGVLITRSITRALGAEPAELSAVVGRVADGDLTTRLHVRSGDNGSVMVAVDRMQTSLARVVSSVRQSADSVATASNQIAAGNLDLSSRTEEQAASLEETASSMEALTSTVKQNAENAHHANQLAITTSDVAVRGGEVVGQVVDTMASIKASSSKIADIIGVIDGIAFQTNILALNAAVEAARAGQQGRGFAVVATEVRSLAQRSAGAAKEIKALIEDSVDKVDIGSKLVDEAGKTMEEIVNSVKRVTDIMSEIAASSQKQSSGIEQVNQAIAQMDEVTQQNAALVEEAAAASESLHDQAQNLSQAVSVFKLEGGSQTSHSRRRSIPVLHGKVDLGLVSFPHLH